MYRERYKEAKLEVLVMRFIMGGQVYLFPSIALSWSQGLHWSTPASPTKHQGSLRLRGREVRKEGLTD